MPPKKDDKQLRLLVAIAEVLLAQQNRFYSTPELNGALYRLEIAVLAAKPEPSE